MKISGKLPLANKMQIQSAQKLEGQGNHGDLEQ